MVLSRLQAPLGVFDFILVLDHLKPGFNLGKIIRTANALGCREVHLVGISMFDPSPTKGTLKQTKTKILETAALSFESLKAEGYQLFAMSPDAKLTLGQIEIPEKSAFIFGHEEFDLSFSPDDFPDIKRMRIAQFGIVESLNVSVAAALACYEYTRQRGFVPIRSEN